MKYAMLLILSLLTVSTFAQSIDRPDYLGNWSAIEQSVHRNMDVCQRYTVQLGEEGRGRLTIEVMFSAGETEQYTSNFYAFIPFRHEASVTEEGASVFVLDINFSALQYTFESDRYFQFELLPPNYQQFLEELRTFYFQQNFQYEVEVKGTNYLMIKSFDRLGSDEAMRFQQRGNLPSCKQLMRS